MRDRRDDVEDAEACDQHDRRNDRVHDDIAHDERLEDRLVCLLPGDRLVAELGLDAARYRGRCVRIVQLDVDLVDRVRPG
ncbi:hypothetical protein D3C72_2482050 [compost metagenome]